MRVSVTLDRDAVRIPDSVAMKIDVEAESGVELTLPKIEGRFGGFLVGEAGKPETRDDRVTQHVAWKVALESVLPGKTELPPVVVGYHDRRPGADGTPVDQTGEVQCTGLSVDVQGSLADVRGPTELPAPWSRTALYWGLAAMAALVTVALLARWIRRRRGRLPTARRAPAVPPHVWALRELASLMAERLVEAGRVQEFYYRLNGLVRRYIELRFGLMAAEQTSEEFIRALAGSARLVDEHKMLLREFTAACDPVKYAKHRPAPSDIEWVTKSARRFIEESAPRAESGAGQKVAERESAEALV